MTTETKHGVARDGIWLRGLWMLILVVLFGVAETLLFLSAVIQFFWMLVTGDRNRFITEFGDKLANWLAITARFQTARSEQKPFPWSEWK